MTNAKSMVPIKIGIDGNTGGGFDSDLNGGLGGGVDLRVNKNVLSMSFSSAVTLVVSCNLTGIYYLNATE